MAAMFNTVAPRYDFLNSLLSFGIHRSWRRKAIDLLKDQRPQQILDVATGTADFAIEALRLNPLKVTGVDISEGMLLLGKAKIKKRLLENKIELLQADSENLPFLENSFDAATVAFGVRNFEQLDKGVSAIYRVLKPGGRLVVLEFSNPKNLFIKFIYSFYFSKVTPFIGRIFSADAKAYQYLPESVSAFPDGPEFLEVLKRNGFVSTSFYSLTFNVANIYVGKK